MVPHRQNSGAINLLKRLDAWPKLAEDFHQRTLSGGIITIVASVVMGLLFLSELRLFASRQTVHELSVDTSRGATIEIHFDVTFPRMPCSWLSLDAMDVSGELHLEVEHDVFRQRLDSRGRPKTQPERHNVSATTTTAEAAAAAKAAGGAGALGGAGGNVSCMSCYGADDEEHPCCNTCDEVRAAYARKGWAIQKVSEVDQCRHDHYLSSVKEQEGEGCHLWGKLEVNKVAGNFHFAAGRSMQHGAYHMHDLSPFDGKTLDFTHRIGSLSFGSPYPGMRNPLDGTIGGAATGPKEGPHTGMYQYFLKVVPTAYTDLANATIHTNQYSVTENYHPVDATDGTPGGHVAPGRVMPGVFVYYELHPIRVDILEQQASILHFLTNVCAIVGGVFTVSGLIDGAVFHSSRLIRKKMELGKLT